MDSQPKQNNNTVKQHQEAVIDLFPQAKKDLYGEIPLYKIIPISTPESLNRDNEKREALKDELKVLIPGIYESYTEDLKLLQARNPEATLLDVHYDTSEEIITAPPVHLRESFISSSRLGGSMGRSMDVPASVESDYLASIQKRTLLISDEGMPEDLYIVGITRHNSVVTDDIHRSWEGKDGDRVAHIAVDTTYNDIFAETPWGAMDQTKDFRYVLDILKKAFPKTTK
jgi:hypothetical protein